MQVADAEERALDLDREQERRARRELAEVHVPAPRSRGPIVEPGAAAGATPMHPIEGRNGTASDPFTATLPSSTGSSRTRAVSIQWPSEPTSGIHADQVRSIRTSRTSTLSASPGRAPVTATGPVTRFTRSIPICSRVSPAASRA